MVTDRYIRKDCCADVKILSGIKILVILCIFLFSSLFVINNYSLTAYASVYDKANILTDTEKSILKNKVDALEEMTGWDVMVVFTNTTDGKNIQTYTDDTYEFYSSSEDGVCFCIYTTGRVAHISTFGEAIQYLKDRHLNTILDELYNENTYYGRMRLMLEKTIDMYEKGQLGVDNGFLFGLTAQETVISVFFAVIVGIGYVVYIYMTYNLHWGTPKYDYKKNSEMELTVDRDTFIRTYTTRHKIRTSSSGGSSTHRTSSGRRAGGASRRF